MKRGSMTTIVFLLVFLLLSGPVLAAVPWLVGYQGKVTDSEQVPLDGTYTMIFRLYSFEGATSPIWAEEQTVSVTNGVFQVQLGSGANIVGGDLDSTLIAGQDRWLEIEIEGEVLSPRQQLTSAAYALRAETADSALHISGALPSTIAADDEGYALSVSNSGTGGAAELDGFVNVDHGNLLVQGEGSFDVDGEVGALYLGDSMNYIKAVHGSGVSIGTFEANDAIVVEQGSGNVGIGTSTPAARLDVAGTVHSSGAFEVGSGVKNLAIFTDGAVVDLKSTGAALGINYPGDTDTVINVNGGRVGIGVDPPSEKLSVNGTVESTSGGFKFPDGSSQASAGASQVYVTALEARIASLETKMAAMETLLANVTRSGSDITFSGVNVHVVNGTGTTNGTPNGVGNLIVGYNEVRGDGDDRSGSHNVVIGSRHNYASYGGLVTGYYNTISGIYASVSGGYQNTADGPQSSVSGGRNNAANGEAASISGGFNNNAAGKYASVSGGVANSVTGERASVSGGSFNRASGFASYVGGGGSDTLGGGNEAFGDYTAILGGDYNITGDPNLIDHSAGQNATISGGSYNRASGSISSVSGGSYNTASGQSSSVSGGNLNTAWDYDTSVSGGRNNNASGMSSSVSGGVNNTASGNYSFVGGGQFNRASNGSSSVSGGLHNTASGFGTSVSGGNYNTASADTSSVSGGEYNTASGANSSVSGGRYNKASGDYSFVGGGGHPNPAYGNVAFSNYSAVLGGSYNIAGDNSDPEDHSIGELATIAGGDTNRAKGGWSSITGGFGNTTESDHTSVSGGQYNMASGSFAIVSGGSSNQAVGSYSAVLGGFENIAGDSDPAFGWSSVSGGQHNTASGSYSFVGGGEDNHAFSFKSAIIGGHSNLTGGTRTHGVWSTIAGGEGNLSQGNFSSITGGQGNDTGVSSDHSSVIGGANNTADNAFDSVVGDAGAVYVDSTQVH